MDFNFLFAVIINIKTVLPRDEKHLTKKLFNHKERKKKKLRNGVKIIKLNL